MKLNVARNTPKMLIGSITFVSIALMRPIRFLLQTLLFLSIASILSAQSAPPSALTDHLDVRAQSVAADTIILCSTMPNISPNTVGSFAQEALNAAALPEIIAGSEPYLDQGGSTVYFYFGFSEKEGHNFESADCLTAFPPLTQSYSEILGGMAEGVGIKPNFLPHPERYAPVVAKQKTIYEDGVAVVLYVGLQGSDFPHVRTAAQYLFGLPDGYCQKNCPEVEEIDW